MVIKIFPLRSFSLMVVLMAGTLLFVATPAFSVKALVHKTVGKVEVKVPGGSWRRAEQGMELTGGTTISTGFNSETVIRIGETSLDVKPLTRMSLESLIEQDDSIDTALHLEVGKIKADVRSSEGLRNNFRIRSAQSTAAVRGTSFEYDGYNLSVQEGSVIMANGLGQQQSTGAGLTAKVKDATSAPSGQEAGGGTGGSGDDSYYVATGAVTGGGSLQYNSDTQELSLYAEVSILEAYTDASVTIVVDWDY